MKFLAQLLVLVTSAHAFGSGITEDKVYSLLENNGAVVRYSSTTVDRTGKIELSSIHCIQMDATLETHCFYTDAVRPAEGGTIEGASAADMYEAMIVSGAKTGHLFGETHVALSILRCEKTVSSIRVTQVRCSTMKPLLYKAFKGDLA